MEIAMIVYVLVAVAIPVFLYHNSKRKRVADLIDRIPGPVAFPLIGNSYLIFRITRNSFFSFFDELSRKFYPIMRTWSGTIPEVHLSDAEHIEAILSSSVNLEKSFMYTFLQPWLGTGLLTSTGRKWHTHRKLITPTFHFKILENFNDVFVKKSLILVKKLEKEIGNTRGFDVYPYITLCALDVICETAMGIEMNAQDNVNSPYVAAVYDMSEVVLRRILFPWLANDFIYSFTDDYKRSQRNLRVLHGFTNKVIQERKRDLVSKKESGKADENEDILGKKKKTAFLDLLLEVSQSGAELTDEEIREEVDTFMFEGHDTTSASLCWTLFLLGHHPDVQERAFEELDTIFQGSDRPPEMQDFAEMKYLERVIKESLRLYPSVPIIGRKVIKEVQCGEYTIPEGTLLNVNIYQVHRNPKYFPDPEKFNPDNFLPERAHGRHPYAYVPFSAGSRNCIGQKFALLEEKTILSYIIRNFKIRSLEEISDITLLGELILRPANGVKLTLERR